jgi:SAM-dependent methyltransferase/glycosyltransferase involved in cell wall biosynthesis
MLTERIVHAAAGGADHADPMLGLALRGHAMARTLVIADPNLKNLTGHYFEYDRAVAEAAVRSGFDCITLAHSEAALPPGMSCSVAKVYSGDMWKTIPGESYLSARNIDTVSAEFAAETLKYLDKQPLRDRDVIFFPTITQVQLPAVATLAEAYGPRGVRLCALLRYQRFFYKGRVAARAFRRLEKVAKRSAVILCSDSHRLARAMSSLTALPIEVFPIPHTGHMTSQQPRTRTADTVNFVSLGNARGEKGLAEIFNAIRKSATFAWGNRARFILQCNDPSEDIVDAIKEFRRDPDPRVELIDQALSTEEYYGLLQDADVVLVPYHRSIYRARTSGVFLEAVTAAKVVVCTRDTWMSDLLDMHGGGIAVRDRSASGICAAIGTIIGDLPQFQQRASAAASHWMKIHSAENFLTHLLGKDGRSVAVATGRRAAILFPWGDAVSVKSGSAVRLKFLVRYLEQRFAEVRVLFVAGGSESGGEIGTRSSAEPYYCMRIRARALRIALEAVTRCVGGRPDQGFHLWFHLWPRIDGRFRRRCEELVRWSDDIYIEYSYFAPIVDALCRGQGKTCHVTMHDVVSDQSAGVPLIHQATRDLEFGAIRNIERIYSASENDCREFLKAGIRAQLIPHPIDMDEALPIYTKDEISAIFDKLLGIPEGARRICFFVGSNYGPNRTAAAFIRDLAGRMRDGSEVNDIVFLVAGGCMAPIRDGNFVALGVVEGAILSACYQRADIILVPLTEGTGTSIKSIEALARGGLVLSTTVGMRGLPVATGRHCVIEDDLLAYPQRILELLGDPDKAHALRTAAMAFGSSYDYRALFTRYVEGQDDRCPPDEEDRQEAIGNRKRSAIHELLPRLQALESSQDRDFFRAQFGLTEQEMPVKIAKEVVSEPSSPAAMSEPPPGKHSLLWRVTKQVLLLFPPIRVLYQQVLLANARTAWGEAELRRMEDLGERRVTLFEGQLRDAEQRALLLESERDRAEGERAAAERAVSILESDRSRAEGERAAAEQRLLDRISGLETLLRETKDANARLESQTSSLLAVCTRKLEEMTQTQLNLKDSLARSVQEAEQRDRDLIDLALRRQPLSAPVARLVTENPLAIDSADHVFPRGTRNDNTRHLRFVRACEKLFPKPIRHLDLGCAGGGLVWDFLLCGHVSYGIEGSNLSKLEQRAEWRSIPEYLFTADITKPFGFADASGNPLTFQVISAWEVLEHIHEKDLPRLIENIDRHLAPSGVFVASVATFEDRDPSTGAVWHVTVRPPDWWHERFSSLGWSAETGLFSHRDFVRGIDNPSADDWDAKTQPEMGFHLVYRKRTDT